MKRPESTEEFVYEAMTEVDKINKILNKIDQRKEVDEDKARYVLSHLEDTVDDLVSIYGIQQLF